MSNQKQRQNQRRSGETKHRSNPWMYPLKIGFFAGIIWGLVRWMFYQIKFTTVLPGFAGDPFFQRSFLKSGWGVWAGFSCYVLFSMFAALIYKLLLGKLRGPWPGIIYGAVWWLIVFVWLGPMLGMMDPITKAGWNTLYSELCVFLLWGLFIGYSIAFEFTDEASREPILSTS